MWPTSRVKKGLPHACGGVSYLGIPLPYGTRSSPRVWGCFLLSVCDGFGVSVFPTRVGVFLRQRHCIEFNRSLPHACGGVSQQKEREDTAVQSSPRVWGCFLTEAGRAFVDEVFPTRVGVFLRLYITSEGYEGLPHACGGVSFLISVRKI